MYVIFPADEVVYLSYGRLIVVPANSNPENSNTPIRTNSLPLGNTNSDSPLTTSSSTKSKRSTYSEPIPGPSRIEYNLVENQPSTSRGNLFNQIYQETKIPQDAKPPQESKPKKRSLKLNFNLIKRNNSSKSKNSEQTLCTPRVRYSIGNRDQARGTTPPSEAFRKYCYISPPEPNIKSITPPASESKYSLPDHGKILPFSSKRSSSSSKNSKPSSLKEEQESKDSSKHSSSSSKSTKQEKSLPIAFCNNTSGLQRSQSNIQRDIQKEPTRKISATTTLSADVFYPLSTSREKNLVEPSPEPKLKTRSSSFRISLRRSKTPEVSESQPIRPERKKEKEKKPVKSKSTSERKLSFSDFLTVGRERSSDIYPEVVVTSEREKSPLQRDKSPVLGFFRKTPSPKHLGRDRTPNLNRDPGIYTNQNLLHEPQIEDNPRPSSTGHKHTSGEDSIMRVAIFNTNTTNIKISLALLTVYRLLMLVV